MVRTPSVRSDAAGIQASGQSLRRRGGRERDRVVEQRSGHGRMLPDFLAIVERRRSGPRNPTPCKELGKQIHPGKRRGSGAKFMHKKLILILGTAAMLATSPVALAQGPRGDEPVAVPRTIKQGIDFVYVDPQMSSVAPRKQKPQNWLQRLFNPSASRRGAPNPLFDQLGRGLQQYQASWGRLPQTKIPPGASLQRGSTGKRVSLLRTRLGLPAAGGYDDQLADAVSAYQAVHGLGNPDGIAGRATIASLNRGSLYYARRIAIN